MKLSVFSNLYRDKRLEELLSKLRELGISSLELSAGGYFGKELCSPAELLKDKTAFYKFRETFNTYDIDICALSVHGNPVHPNKETASGFDADFKNAVLLAEMLEIDTVVTFSGCPGDSQGSCYPNWVTCPWPEDFGKLLDWQWNEVLLPYWYDTAKFTNEHGVTKIAIDMHQGFSVYNPETALKLRSAVGDTLGVSLDPSSLVWQGIDPSLAVRELAGAIYHVNAKDTRIDKYNTAKNGVIDTKDYRDMLNRSWSFSTVGYGSTVAAWGDFASALRTVGYDGAVSIDVEDNLISPEEGLKKAAEFLKAII